LETKIGRMTSKRRSSYESILAKRAKLHQNLASKSATEALTLPVLLNEFIPISQLIRIVLDYDESELVLTVGGWGNGHMETMIEAVRFDSRANAFLKIAEARLPSELWGHALVLDDEKRILVIGGRANGYGPNPSRQIMQISTSPLACTLLPKTQYVGLQTINNDSGSYAACAGTNYRDNRKNACFVSMIASAVIKQYTFHDGSERSIDLSRATWAGNNTVSVHERGATLCVTDNLLWIYMDTHHLACYDFSAPVTPVSDIIRIPGLSDLLEHSDYVYLSYVKSLSSRRLLLSTGISIHALNIDSRVWTNLVPNTGLLKQPPRYHSGPLICDSSLSMFGHDQMACFPWLKRFDITTGAPLPINNTKSILARSRISTLTL
jgi:hypothetical protein